MAQPVTIDVPHRLGRDGAKARLQARIGELAGHIPGGVAEVAHSWPAPHEMALEIGALGAQVSARLEVQDSIVRVHLILPAMLAFFSGMIGAAVKEGGTKLLEDRRG